MSTTAASALGSNANHGWSGSGNNPRHSKPSGFKNHATISRAILIPERNAPSTQGAKQKSPHQPSPWFTSNRQPREPGGVFTGKAQSQRLMRWTRGRWMSRHSIPKRHAKASSKRCSALRRYPLGLLRASCAAKFAVLSNVQCCGPGVPNLPDCCGFSELFEMKHRSG